ncbi:MAG: MBL fold metallo-hydrolase [Clostridia bacterium]|nr:MBL fold metallo-hydrolase [Clostridia bacterium]
MLLEKIVVGSYAVNCYILGDEVSKEAIVVDPGAEADRILKKINDKSLSVKYIVLTHGHGDHIGAVEALKTMTGAQVMIHHDDAYMLEDASKNFSSSIHGNSIAFKPDRTIGDGDVIQIGKIKIRVLHTPGHTYGGICLYAPNEKIVITGDTLFYGSVGRSDLEGGDHKQMIGAIIKQLMKLGDEVSVYPGHGASTSIGFERRKNPFIQG